MKLNFHHRGRQFFFVTLTLEGRPAALSRLVDEASPPTLTPRGETALAVLLALHKVYPARRSPTASSCPTTSTS